MVANEIGAKIIQKLKVAGRGSPIRFWASVVNQSVFIEPFLEITSQRRLAQPLGHTVAAGRVVPMCREKIAMQAGCNG
jgi:hypothetical protein